MGVWSKIAGYGLMIGGVAAAPYTGGASLALVGAGGNIVKGDMLAEGAEKAAKQQQAAGDKAIGTLSAANAAAQQAYSPYTGTGAAAMGTLGGLMGLPSGGGQGAAFNVAPQQPMDAVGAAMPYAGTAQPRTGTASPQATATLQTASGYGGSGGTLGGLSKGGLVRMRAPTGDVQLVSPEDVEHFKARGAEQVA